MRKYLLPEILALVVVFVGTLVLVRGLANRSSRDASNPSKSLRIRAQNKGAAVVGAEPRNLKKYDELRSLANDSATIVTGTVGSSVSSLLQPSETLVVTDYLVSVDEVFKGNTASGKNMTVREPGGHVELGNGTSAEVQMPEYWKQPQTGEKYIFFLKNRSDGTFSLVGGPQGLFKFSEGKVTPQMRPDDKLMQTYNGKSGVSFLKELRDAIKH